MTYYQVQIKPIGNDWKPYGESSEKRLDANKLYLDFITQHYNSTGVHYEAVRICSVVQHWDKVWRVKEVLTYKDLDETKA